MNNNNNTMNNNNNDNDNTMNNTSNVSSSNSLLMVEAVLSTPAQKHQLGTSSALYKVAARNLREYHGVPSMTALKLEKTVALLGLAPRRMVVQGLAPRRLLKGGKSGPLQLVLAGESSDETGELVDENLIINNNSSSEDEEEGGGDSNSTYGDNNDNIGDYSGDDPEGDVEGFEADGNRNGKTRRPIHAALVAGGVNLRPRETRPLLCALGVSPRRLVKLGLVKREVIRSMAGGRGGGRDQHLRSGGRGKRGVERPRDPSCGPPRALGGPSSGCGPSRHMHGPHGPPHAHPSCGPTSGGGLSRPMHGPPRLFHGAGHHTMRLGEESGEEGGISAPMGPDGGPGHRGPRHHGGCLQRPPHGPGHHSMPTGRHGRGPPGGGKHGHGHGHDGGCLHGEEDVEGGERLRGRRARGPGQHGPSRRGRGMGRPRGPPHAQADAYDCCGPSPGSGQSRPIHGPPPRPFHGASRHAMHLEEESEEEGMFTSPGSHGGPGHRGSRHPGRGGMGGRSCGRPQEPPHGPVHGSFHGLFHEGAPGAPPGTMAHPHHGSPSRGGCGMTRRDRRHGGGTGFCGRRCGGGGGGGMRHGRMAHLAHFDSRQQPQLEAC